MDIKTIRLILNYDTAISKLESPVLNTTERIRLHKRISEIVSGDAITPFDIGFKLKLKSIKQKIENLEFEGIKYFTDKGIDKISYKNQTKNYSLENLHQILKQLPNYVR